MDDLFIEETEHEKYEREIRDKYRTVFSTGTGREVLADILLTCHAGKTLDPDNKVQIAEYNVGKVIMDKSGIMEIFFDTLLGLRKINA